MRTKIEIKRQVTSLTDYLDDDLSEDEKHEVKISIDTMLYCLNENPYYFPDKFPEKVTRNTSDKRIPEES